MEKSPPQEIRCIGNVSSFIKVTSEQFAFLCRRRHQFTATHVSFVSIANVGCGSFGWERTCCSVNHIASTPIGSGKSKDHWTGATIADKVDLFALYQTTGSCSWRRYICGSVAQSKQVISCIRRNEAGWRVVVTTQIEKSPTSIFRLAWWFFAW